MTALRVLILLALGLIAGPSDDSDGDGLTDAVEEELAWLGTDPGRPDVLVEADWEACDPQVQHCGFAPDLDRNRMSTRVADALAAHYAPDVAVHVDRGQYGAEGGANRVPRGTHYCDLAQMDGERIGRFHHAVVGPGGTGGQADMGGFCFGADSTSPGVLAQELGHNFGLGHGGIDGDANCKPNYRSPMNYGYTYDETVTRLSRGERSLPLLPMSLDELAGVGSTDPAVLASLADDPWAFKVRPDGAIDWNRDGVFETGVRGAPNWAWASCEQGIVHEDSLEPGFDPLLVADDDGFFLFSRRPDDGRLELRRSSSRVTPAECPGTWGACMPWSPPRGMKPNVVPDSTGGAGAPGAAFFGGALHVAYADGQGALRHQILDVAAGTWSPPDLLAPVDDSGSIRGSAVATAREVTLLTHEGRLSAYAAAGGVLSRWDWRPGDGTGAQGRWQGPYQERWLGGEVIRAAGQIAPAFTVGKQADRVDDALYAAFATAPFGELAFARWEPQSGWRRLDTSFAGRGGYAAARPGLAWSPIDRRFFLAWKPFPSGNGVVISMTEGDDAGPAAEAAEARRLRWLRPAYLGNVWSVAAGSVSLLHDGIALRATFGFGGQSRVEFEPFADGIIPRALVDHDDLATIRDRLACSLGVACSSGVVAGGQAGGEPGEPAHPPRRGTTHVVSDLASDGVLGP